MCASLARLWQTLRATAAQQLTDAGLDAPAALEPEAAAAIRQVVDDYYRDYLARRRKRRWCDKSLDNVIFASLIGHVFPDARFICLYRHCMDMIASGVEASPWGLQGFGFENFVVQYPGNSIAALGSYWLDRTRTMLAFEQQHPGRCLRIRYEDLVSAPEEAAASMFSFLDVEQVPGITETCFRSEHDLYGPGDLKIWFTSRISADSVGRGVRIPANAIPLPMLDDINGTLGALGYRPVGERWNASSGYVDPRDQYVTPGEPPTASAPETRTGPAAEVATAAREEADEILEMISWRMAAVAAAHAEVSAGWPALTGTLVRIVVEGDGSRSAAFLWQFGAGVVSQEDPCDQPGQQEPGSPCAAIIGGTGTWRSLLAGEANMAVEFMAGRLRCVDNSVPGLIRSPEVHAVACLLGLAEVPQVPRAAGPGRDSGPPPGGGHPPAGGAAAQPSGTGRRRRLGIPRLR